MLGVPWGSDQELIPGVGRGVWPSRLAPPVGMSPGMSCWHRVGEEPCILLGRLPRVPGDLTECQLRVLPGAHAILPHAGVTMATMAATLWGHTVGEEEG